MLDAHGQGGRRGDLHKVGLQQVFTGADVLGIHKGQAPRGLHLVHHCQQLRDLLHFVVPLLPVLLRLVPFVLVLHATPTCYVLNFLQRSTSLHFWLLHLYSANRQALYCGELRLLSA